MTLQVPLPIQATGVKAPASQFYGMIDDLMGVGVVGANDLQVIQNPAGADLSVSVAPGAAYFSVANGGKRRVLNDANSNSGRPGAPNATDWLTTFTAPDATRPRVDRVVVMVRDANTGDGTGAYDVKFKVIAGAPTAGATLANLTGAAAVPTNCLLLANVLVAANATTIATANVDTTVRSSAKVGGGGAPLQVVTSPRYSAKSSTSVSTANNTFAAGVDLLPADLTFQADGVSDYLLVVSVPELSSAGGTSHIDLKLDGVDSGIVGAIALAASGVNGGTFRTVIVAPSAGAHTVNLRGHTVGGSGGTFAANAGVGGSGVDRHIVVTVEKL